LDITQADYDTLHTLIRVGTHAARTSTRARMLLLSATGDHTVDTICAILDVCPATVFNVRKRYRSGGLQTALYDRARSGFPPKVTPREEAQITTIACSAPPAGRARWTIDLITDRLVSMYGTDLSHESVRRVLKKVNSSHGNTASGV
jgi:transposase